MSRRETIADILYARLGSKVIRLAIRPGDTLSEAEVARRFAVSRQPVREAFIHLAEDGFPTIRPQRPTVVTPIAERDVLNAQFIREAIETAVVAEAAPRWGHEDARARAAIIARQEAVAAEGDREGFHAQDEAFHREIAAPAGHRPAWEAIDRHKAQMDRMRFLAIDFTARRAIAQHHEIARALARRDGPGAAMRAHLSTIKLDLAALRAEHGAFFEPDAAPADAPAQPSPR